MTDKEGIQLVVDSDGEQAEKVAAQLRGMGFDVVRGNVEACAKCDFFECVCKIREAHGASCPYRFAMTCSIGIDCEEHGHEVCSICDACTCKKST